MLEVGLSTRRHKGFQDDQRDYGKDDIVAEIALRIRQGIAERPQGLFVDEIAMCENGEVAVLCAIEDCRETEDSDMEELAVAFVIDNGA